MKKRHITEFLDEIGFKDLSADQMAEINSHVPNCDECKKAFQSAQLASFILKENSNMQTPVPPFFQAKVLNAWREKQIVQKPLAVFWRWWQASATLVLLMFVTVIGLMTATFFGSRSETAANRADDSKVTLYSTETVILNQRTVRNLTTEQVFEVLDDK